MIFYFYFAKSRCADYEQVPFSVDRLGLLYHTPIVYCQVVWHHKPKKSTPVKGVLSNFFGALGRVCKPTDVYLLLPFRPQLRHFPLTCPGTTAEKFLVDNENSAKSTFVEVCRHALGLIWRKEGCP